MWLKVAFGMNPRFKALDIPINCIFTWFDEYHLESGHRWFLWVLLEKYILFFFCSRIIAPYHIIVQGVFCF